jgi:penicillin-binding protein 2
MDSNENKHIYRDRRYIISGVFIVVLLLFISRFFYLQLMSDAYKASAESNAFQRRTLYPSRGVIYDRQGQLLVYNQPSYDVMVTMHEVKEFDTLSFCTTIGVTRENFESRIAAIRNRALNPGYSPYVPQVFLSQLESKRCARLQEQLINFPGFYIRNRTLREYGYHNAPNVLGYISEVSAKDIERDDYYSPRDYAGRSGVESSYEKILRGVKGQEILLRDNHGRIKGKYNDGADDVEPVSGKNITLSLNLELQTLGERLMQNKKGAIVMIEPASGEILCLVSSPTFDPALLNGEQKLRANYTTLVRDPNKPLFDRSIQGRYSPGSTFKPAQGLIFLQEKVINRDKLYSCAAGYPYLGGHPACHAHYSPLSLVPALATSCNAFFCWGLHDMLDSRARYKTIQEAFEQWKDYMVSMGYGYPLGVDLPGEDRGFIPNSKTYDKIYNGRWTSSSIVGISIGQHEIGATPLQMCNLAATIANRGWFITPHVVHEIQDTPLDKTYTTKRYTNVDSEYYDIVVEGMRNAVTGGTCKDMWLSAIEVCGKTGTVQNPHGRDHSACISFAPRNNPKVAIAVFVENGGFGAWVAVPIAKLMLEKFFFGDVLAYDKYLEVRMQNWSTAVNSINYIKRTEEATTNE